MKSLVNSGFIGFIGSRTSVAGGRHIKYYFPNLIRPAFGLAVLVFGWMIAQDATAASFSLATPLNTARGGQTATLLSNGKLLVAGGQTNGGFTSSTAELYDRAVGTWTAT